MPNPAVEYLDRVRTAAESVGFSTRIYGHTPNSDLVMLERAGDVTGPHIYLSTGVHGDEPAGPEALIQLLKGANCLPNATWTLFPLINPEGYIRKTRENADGVDLNRDYKHPSTIEAIAHRKILDSLGPFDLTLSLHEDWESSGFYLYELNSTDVEGIAGAALKSAGQEGPIDLSTEIDGRPAADGIVQASATFFDDRDDWPEQIFLFKTRTKLCYTFETPSALPLEVRIRMQLAACQRALENFCMRHWQ